MGNAHKKEHYRLRHDTHHSCSAAYYAEVVADMGFQQVLHETLDRSKAKHFAEEKVTPTYVCARPDGFILTWNTYCGRINAAKLTFQSKVFANGTWSAQKGSRDTIYVRSEDVREGLREKMNSTSTAGALKTWRRTTAFDSGRYLVLEQDYTHQREQNDIPDGKYDKLSELVDAVHARRAAAMPHWVKEMTASLPSRRRGPQPV